MRLILLSLLCNSALAAGLGCPTVTPQPLEDALARGQKFSRDGCFAQARAEFAAALHMATASSDYRTAAMILDYTGINEEDSGDYAKAETNFNHGLATVTPYAPYDPVLVDLRTHLAELYIAESRPEDAAPLLRRTIGELRRSPQPDPLFLARGYQDLALAYILLHKYDEPERLLRQSQTLLETHLGPDHPRLATGLFAIAALLSAEHKYTDAVAPAEQAWKILHTTKAAVTDADLATACSALSAVYFHVGRIDEASSMARKAVELAEAVVGPNHPCVARCLNNYAYILRRSGHKAEAKAMQKWADDIVRQSHSAGAGGTTINIAALH